MKRLLLCLILLVSTVCTRATNFTLVIATTDSAYARYVEALAVVDTDLADIAALGTLPTAPVYDSTGTQWSNYVQAVGTYNTSLTTYQDSLITHKATLRTKELTLLASLGYNTAYTNIPVNQWIKVQGGTFGTAWIGFSDQSTYIVVSTVQPTAAFPKIYN